MPPLCLLTFCFPLIPIIICTCASFPLIVFKPVVFLCSLLCFLFLFVFEYLLRLFVLYLPPCGFTFLSWRITFVLVEFLLRLWSYMFSWRTSLFTSLNTPSQVLLCLPHLLGSANYSWLSWLSDCFSLRRPGFVTGSWPAGSLADIGGGSWVSCKYRRG